MELGVPLEGRLSPGDALLQGALVDYYSLRLVDSTGVVVTLTSAEVDPFLYLFGPDGRVAAQAFDSVGTAEGEIETATIERRLPPGCHLIGVSSWTRGARGAYTFRADSVDVAPIDGGAPSRPADSPTGRSNALN